MLCTRCKKRTAVVFITAIQGEEKKNEGLCLVCARELNIPQVKEYMDQMGITDDEIEQFADEMTEFSDDFDMGDGDSFERGGTGAIPPFIQNMLGGIQNSLGHLGSAFSANRRQDDGEDAEPVSPKMGGHTNPNGAKKGKGKFLETYCTNLTQQAADGELDRIIGREKEIARTIQILSRRQKNNPCLIGEPGVGKTAIVEGIAQKIVSGDVPFRLKNKQLYLLDLTALVAGTQFRGQFESRVKGLIEEVKAEGNIILFIDEVHSLVGAGDSEGSMNAANILKPALSRGEVQVIGATTFNEYRKYIEKDSALERRFQPVTVPEPTVENTYDVLLGIREYYENHHRVKISDELLRRCAVLSERYINDRFLPDKAIDLLDEACAYRCIRSDELSDYDSTVENLEKLRNEQKDYEDSSEPDYAKLAEIKGEISREEEKLSSLEKAVSELYVTEADI